MCGLTATPWMTPAASLIAEVSSQVNLWRCRSGWHVSFFNQLVSDALCVSPIAYRRTGDPWCSAWMCWCRSPWGETFLSSTPWASLHKPLSHRYLSLGRKEFAAVADIGQHLPLETSGVPPQTSGLDESAPGQARWRQRRNVSGSVCASRFRSTEGVSPPHGWNRNWSVELPFFESRSTEKRRRLFWRHYAGGFAVEGFGTCTLGSCRTVGASRPPLHSSIGPSKVDVFGVWSALGCPLSSTTCKIREAWSLGSGSLSSYLSISAVPLQHTIGKQRIWQPTWKLLVNLVFSVLAATCMTHCKEPCFCMVEKSGKRASPTGSRHSSVGSGQRFSSTKLPPAHDSVPKKKRKLVWDGSKLTSHVPPGAVPQPSLQHSKKTALENGRNAAALAGGKNSTSKNEKKRQQLAAGLFN